MPWEARIASQVSVKVASPVAQQEPELLDAVRQVHEEGAGLLGDRFPGWLAVTPRRWTRRVETSSTNRTYRRLRKTVSAGRSRRPRSLGLGGQELLPGQAGAAWCRVDAASFGEQPHRARCDLLSKPGQFTVDAPVAPRRVLRCHRQDQATQFWHRRGPTGLAVRVGPAAVDQVPMPAQHCLWRHESMEPMLCWEEAGQRRETARSGQKERGRLTCRGKTATWWRTTRISALLDACARASSPSQPTSWQKIR